MSESRFLGSGRRTSKLVYFFGALGAVIWGYDLGSVSGALLFVREDLGLSPFLQGLVVSSIAVGAVVGSFSGPIADFLGRRRHILIAAIAFSVGAIGAALAITPAMLVVFRIFMGIGIGMASIVVPMYLAEMAPTRIRGAISSLNQQMINVGILVAFLVSFALAAYGAWRWMFGLALVPSLILLVGMYFMPETPRWLVKQGREEDAREVLRRIREEESADDVEDVIREIKEIERTDTEEGRVGLRELSAPWVRPALLVAVGLGVFQQLIGPVTITYYAPTVFTDVGFGNQGAIAANISIGVVSLIFTMIAIRMVDQVGRKPLLLRGLAGMVLSLVVLGTINLLLPKPTGIGPVGIMSVVCLVSYMAFFMISWGPVLWVVMPEVLPLRIRGAAMGVAEAVHFATHLLVSLTFPVLLAAVGVGAVYLGFALMGVLAILFVASQVPETKGRSLEQIEADLRERSLTT